MKEIQVSMDKDVQMDFDINACIGYFDGIHAGHQTLIQAVLAHSKENGAVPALITFDPDPWAILKNVTHIPHLTTMQQRKEIAAELGIECWIVLQFTKEMAALSIADFHTQILNPLRIRTLVCGYDFHYAYRGEGSTATLLAQSQFAVDVIAKVSDEDEKISSSRIERALLAGEMEKVTTLLTRPYTIRGVIVHGLQNGHKLGFPTANLEMCSSYVCPKEGVYVGQVQLDDKWHDAMINVGYNPTFGEGKKHTIEAHILDFDRSIYGVEATYSFLHYIRGDIRFSSLDELIAQLKKDYAYTKAYFKAQRR